MIEISEKDGAVLFAVRVVPRASASEIAGTVEGAVKVRLAAPPVDDAANEELIRLFAKAMRVPKSDVEIVSGRTSRSKKLRIAGVAAEAVRGLIGRG